MESRYMPRIADSQMSEMLRMQGALFVKGPKWCGKTRTSEQFCKSALYISDKTTRDMVRIAVETGSTRFLEGASPRLIDEWQSVPEIWDKVRCIVDHDIDRRFILTGSSTPPEGSTLHSGTGRMSKVVLRPMSLYESGESNGQVSLSSLFEGERVDAYTDLDLDGLIHAIVRGGWPMAVLDDGPDSRRYARRYTRAVIEEDMPRMYSRIDGDEDGTDAGGRPGKGRRTSVDTIREVSNRTLQSISRNIATSASMNTIWGEVNGLDESQDQEGQLVSMSVFRRCIGVMNDMFVLENLEAWNTHVRSSVRLRTKPKWHFTDPSIAAASLNISEARLGMDPNALGLFFESMCLRDVRTYLEPLHGKAGFFTTSNGFEIDFIVELDDGRWGAFEVKLGSREHDLAARNLLKLTEKVDTRRVGEPSFLAVLTGTQMGYTRPDGVHVVPIGSLTV